MSPKNLTVFKQQSSQADYELLMKYGQLPYVEIDTTYNSKMIILKIKNSDYGLYFDRFSPKRVREPRWCFWSDGYWIFITTSVLLREIWASPNKDFIKFILFNLEDLEINKRWEK